MNRMLVSLACDLGQFDIELSQLDVRIKQGGDDVLDEGLVTAFNQYPRRFALSRLWVFGA